MCLFELDRDTLHTRLGSAHEYHSGVRLCAFALVSLMPVGLALHRQLCEDIRGVTLPLLSPADPCPSPSAPSFAADADDDVLGVCVVVVELPRPRCSALELDRHSPRWGDAVVRRKAPRRHLRCEDSSRSRSFSCSNGSGEGGGGGMGRVGGVDQSEDEDRRVKAAETLEGELLEERVSAYDGKDAQGAVGAGGDRELAEDGAAEGHGRQRRVANAVGAAIVAEGEAGDGVEAKREKKNEGKKKRGKRKSNKGILVSLLKI
uniref:Uncharacterized protein n=1 Tax=Ananas comosus var. bracteatus TaxID=296719 RepID=A0A6V7PP71_ANACO|nr:unnamed protein product [Ananas comosus var. bracteatus]